MRLAQVFANLLNNAAKYTDPGGADPLSRVREDEGAVVISVRDNGVGIAPEMLPQRVRPVHPGRPRGRARAGGLGIGLTLVQRLVEMHGGNVAAHSEGRGSGSEFVVRLAARRRRPRPTAAPAAAATRGLRTGCRVLVVDDNRDAAESLAMLLGMLGADVQVAYDGPDALAAMRGLPARRRAARHRHAGHGRLRGGAAHPPAAASRRTCASSR